MDGSPEPPPPSASRRSAPSFPGAVSTVFWCPGPTSTRASTCAVAERLAWLTGFTGSAGLAIVLADRAAVFVDGRYTLQVRTQVDGAALRVPAPIDEPPADGCGQLEPGTRLGYDPWLHTPDEVERLRAGAERAGARCVAVENNPLEAVWADRPAPPLAPVVPHQDRFAGETAAAKRAELAALQSEAARRGGAHRCRPRSPGSSTSAAATCRTRRCRCRSRCCTPTARRTVRRPTKLAPEIGAHLGNAVAVAPPGRFGPALDALAASDARVLVDSATAAVWVVERLEKAGAKVARGQDPARCRKRARTTASSRARARRICATARR